LQLTSNVDLESASASKVTPTHPFLVWIKFTGMSNFSIAVFAFLYWFYPAPRLFIEQWIGFWAAQTYSDSGLPIQAFKY
jgi:hypothetical protein